MGINLSFSDKIAKVFFVFITLKETHVRKLKECLDFLFVPHQSACKDTTNTSVIAAWFHKISGWALYMSCGWLSVTIGSTLRHGPIVGENSITSVQQLILSLMNMAKGVVTW